LHRNFFSTIFPICHDIFMADTLAQNPSLAGSGSLPIDSNLCLHQNGTIPTDCRTQKTNTQHPIDYTDKEVIT